MFLKPMRFGIAAFFVLTMAPQLLWAASPIAVTSEKQLFVDDFLIAKAHRVQRRVQPARKSSANPVLWPSAAWEPQMATVYGSVIQDEGKFKLWYKSGTGVAYAESADGIQWSKPELDLVRAGGHTSNLLLQKKTKTEGPDGFPYFYELFGVHRDARQPDPDRRYVMGFLEIDWKFKGPGGDPWHKGQRRGLGVAGSADGIHWKLIKDWATEAIVDGATHWMFDTNLQRFVLYGRARKALPEVAAAWSTNDWFKQWFSGRAVARVESPNFVDWNYTRPDTAPVALTAELEDRPGTEIYSMKVFRYESVYLGLVQVFHATPEESTLDIEIAASRDGTHFTRIDRGTPLIPTGGIGSWDRFNLSLANNDPLVVGDALRIYYGGRMYRHGPYAGPDKGPERSGIGFAVVPRDRFVALESSFDGGEIVTKPLKIEAGALHLNARANFGRIVVEAMDERGNVRATSKPITRDALDISIEWPEPIKFEEAQVLRIRLENAQVFALWAQ